MKIRLAVLLTLLVVAMGIWYFLPDDECIIKESSVDYNASDEEIYVQVHKEDDRVWALYSTDFSVKSDAQMMSPASYKQAGWLVHHITKGGYEGSVVVFQTEDSPSQFLTKLEGKQIEEPIFLETKSTEQGISWQYFELNDNQFYMTQLDGKYVYFFDRFESRRLFAKDSCIDPEAVLEMI